MQPTSSPTSANMPSLTERLNASFPEGMAGEIMSKTRKEVFSQIGEIIAETTLGPLAKPLLFILKARSIYREARADALRKIRELEARNIMGDIKTATYSVTDNTRMRIDEFLGAELDAAPGVSAESQPSPELRDLQAAVDVLTALEADLDAKEQAIKLQPITAPSQAQKIFDAFTAEHRAALERVAPEAPAAIQPTVTQATADAPVMVSTVGMQNVAADARQEGADAVEPQHTNGTSGTTRETPPPTPQSDVGESSGADTQRDDAAAEYIDVVLDPAAIAEEILAEKPVVHVAEAYFRLNREMLNNRTVLSVMSVKPSVTAEPDTWRPELNPAYAVLVRMLTDGDRDAWRTKNWTDYVGTDLRRYFIPESGLQLNEQEQALVRGFQASASDAQADSLAVDPAAVKAFRQRIQAQNIRGPKGRDTSLDVVYAVLAPAVERAYLRKINEAFGREMSSDILTEADIPQKIDETILIARDRLLA